jgi:dUTPase
MDKYLTPPLGVYIKNPESGITLPEYKTEGAACFDVCADLSNLNSKRLVIPCITAYISWNISSYNEIDDISIILKNQEVPIIEHGDRIAQGWLEPKYTPERIYEKDISEFKNTKRGEGGFGHTGR